MNSLETTLNIMSEVRVSDTKLVYFLFSVTTIAIGYIVQSTRGEILNLSLSLSIFSVIGMGISLAFGFLSIRMSTKSIEHFAMVIGWREYVESISNANPMYLKDSIKKYRLKNDTTGSARDDVYGWIYKRLREKSRNLSGDEFNSYIDNLSDDELVTCMQKAPYEMCGRKSETAEFADFGNASKKSRNHMHIQIGMFLTAASLYFFYYLLTLK